MPKQCYVKKRFRNDSLIVVAQANKIIAEYLQQGYKLTLRQLYYQFVARDLLPDAWIDEVYNRKNGLPLDTKNTLKNYKNLGSIINDARLAGLIDWLAIEDRTRNLQSNSHWDSPSDIVRACAQQFRYDLWYQQDKYVECWIEKEALVGVIEGVCVEMDVPHFACRGYTSQSEMWAAAQRLIAQEDEGKDTIILHLGDHDPSGIDMTRDIQDRLAMFGSQVRIERIALTEDQIDEYQPPPNPAKTTDARYRTYQERYGDESWELDALEPSVIVELIRSNLWPHIDQLMWDAAEERQEQAREQLTSVAVRWNEITGIKDEDSDD